MNYTITSSSNYCHLTEKERFFIQRNLKRYSITEIARLLQRSKSTISREIKRNTFNSVYDHIFAHEKYNKRKLNKHSFKKLKFQLFTKLFILYFDKRKCGVETTYLIIQNIWKDKNISEPLPSLRNVYYWVENKSWIVTRKDTLRSHYKKGGKRTGGYFSTIPKKYMLPYWTRPKHIASRETMFHYEMDLVIGKKASGHSNLLTLVERKSRKIWIERVNSRNPKEIYSVLRRLIIDNKLIVKSITVDNGFEFGLLGILAKQLGFKGYICDPYASHQRGTNERINGDIRRWYPKGTDFNDLTILDLENLERNINEMRRHIFGLKTADQVYKEEYDKYMYITRPFWNLTKQNLKHLHERIYYYSK